MMKYKNEVVESLPMETLNSGESLGSSQSKTVKRKSSYKKYCSEEKPNPSNFEAFLPWLCKQWHCSKTVTVIRFIQETYVNIKDRKTSPKSQRSSRRNYDLITGGVRKSDTSKASKISQITSTSKSSQITSRSKTSEAIQDVVNKTVEESVVVNAYYDLNNHLVKVAFTGASETPRKVIQALSLCLPYHPFLTSLIFHNTLSSKLLYHISKLLPYSNITEISLIDCFVPEANYYVLLEQISDLKCLSLSRCSINDLACKEIVERLEVAESGSPLLSLELDSNLITDKGAEYIAKALRLNRSLLHLNLSGNQLTDLGADMILTQLAEFPLTAAEILERRRRKMKYFENKFAICQRFSDELRQKRVSIRLDSLWSSNKSFLRHKCTVRDSDYSKKPLRSKNLKDTATSLKSTDLPDNAALDIVGEFTDPFEDTGIIKKNGSSYYIGNQVLCSLNLAHNNLSYFSVKRIHEVLKYQQKIKKCVSKIGMLRIVIEGNPVPKACAEYEQIAVLLEALLDFAPSVLSKNKVHK